MNNFWTNVENKLLSYINQEFKIVIKDPIKFSKISGLGLNINLMLKDAVFISTDIVKYIKKNMKWIRIIEFDYNNILYYFSKDADINKYKNDIKHICKIIYSMKKLFHRQENSQKFYYFPTPLKKVITNKTKILGVTECNTGFSYLANINKKCPTCPNGDIYIFRKEEHYKVLIHELIHACYRDQNLILSDDSNKFSSNFCVNQMILLNEAYTETLATVLNLLYIKCINKVNSISLDLNKMFMKEMKYSFYMMNKILQYNQINKFSDIIKKNNSCLNKFYQKTNVFSYYIAKPLLLSHLNDFTKLINGDFSIDENKANKFGKLVIEIVNKIKGYNTIKNGIKNKSLRLTYHEL